MNTEIKERIAQIQNGDIPEGYKRSKVGIIPEDWDIYTVKKMITDNIIEKPLDGNHGNIHPKASDYVEEGIPFLLATDIKDNSIDLINCKKILFTQAESLQKGFSKEGDVLLTHKGTVGNVAILSAIDLPYVMLTPQVTYYRVKDNKQLYNIYLAYIFRSGYFQKQLRTIGKGATRDYIGIVQQQRLNCILPDISEQRKISTILSIQDRIIELKEKLLVEKKRQKKYLMQVLLNPDSPHFKRLPGFSGEWEKVKVGEAFDFLSTNSLSREKMNWIKGSVFNIHYGDIHTKFSVILDVTKTKLPYINDEDINEVSRKFKSCKNGDIILADASEDIIDIGKAIEIKNIKDKTVYSGLHTLHLRKKNDYFADDFRGYIFHSDYVLLQIRKYANGVKVYGISKNNLRKVILLKPSPQEQKQIAKLLFDIDMQIDCMERDLCLHEQKKKALMQLLLTGKVRVKV